MAKYDVNKIRQQLRQQNKKPLSEIKDEMCRELNKKICDPDPNVDPMERLIDELAVHKAAIHELIDRVKALQEEVEELRREKRT